MKLTSPYVLKKDNLIVTKKSRYHAAACYELEPVHFDFKKMSEYEDMLIYMEALISKLSYSGMFLMAPTPFDPYPQLVQGAKTPVELDPYVSEVMENMAKHIRQIPYSYRMYLIIFVEPDSGSFLVELAKSIAEMFHDVTRGLEHLSGGEPYTLSRREWDEFKEKEDLIYTLLSRYLQVRRLSSKETDWLIQRTAMRGIDPDVLKGSPDETDENEHLLFTSPVQVMKAFHDVSLDKKAVPSMLKFEKELPQGIEEGYFSFMVVSRLPKGTGVYPGETTIFKTIQESVTCPVEVCVQFEPLSVDQAKWKLKASKFVSKGRASKQWERASEVSKRTREIMDEATELQEYLDETEYPMFKTRITLCTWGDTPDEVVENREQIAKALKNYELQVPRKLQKQIFYSTLPGYPFKMGYQYFLQLTTEWLAATMPTAFTQLGDPYGFLIGYTGARELQPVFLNPRRGSEDSRRASTGSCLIQGAPGGGKSVLGNYMVYQELFRGAKALVFDPKNERWAWPYEIPHLKDITNVVTLRESDADQGKLDPLARVKNPYTDTAAINSAKSILNYITNRVNDTIYEKVIDKVVDEVIHEIDIHSPSLYRVMEKLDRYLQGQENWGIPETLKDKYEFAIADIYTTLQMRAKSGLTRLLFNDGTNAPLDLAKQLTILQIQGLITGAQQEDNTDTRLRKTVFMAVLDLAREFANEEQGYRTVFIDEAYFITDDKEGSTMLRTLLRTGRSKRNNVILCLHNARDIRLDDDADVEDGGGEVRSNVTNRFIYRLDDRNEAIKACDLLGISATEANLTLLRDRTLMESGCFMMRDFDGNVGMVRFNLEQIDPILYRAFNTSDPEILSEREKQFGHLKNKVMEREQV